MGLLGEKVLAMLEGCGALAPLSDIDGHRAIYMGTAPDSAYPYCVFQLDLAGDRQDAGTLRVMLYGDDECEASLSDIAGELKREISGYAFGGDTAYVLIWEGTRALDSDEELMGTKQLNLSEVVFGVYRFISPTAYAYAAQRALLGVLGDEFIDIHDIDEDGQKCEKPLYAFKAESIRDEVTWPGCAWCALEAGIYLLGAGENAIYGAYELIKSHSILRTDMGGMLLDSVRVNGDADGLTRAPITVVLKYNAYVPPAPAQALNAINMNISGGRSVRAAI